MWLSLCQLLMLPVWALDFTCATFKKVVCKFKLVGKRDKKKKVLIGILCLILTNYLYQTLTMPVRFLFINQHVNRQCIIPDLDPFDKSIMKYVWSPDPIKCDPVPDLMFVNDLGILNYNISAIKFYGSNSFTCSYKILDREPEDDYTVNFGPEVSFIPPFQVPADFFKVQCKDNSNTLVYDKLHESVYNKKVLEHKNIKPESDSKYSVFMFGVDSTSRLSAIRKLPKTYDYITKHLNAFVFKGYMKVADNTFPNLVPILTGKTPWTNELPNIDYKKDSVDSFPFIWQNFSRANYATFFAEDYPELAAFDSEACGFKSPPTDHYMRTWMLGMRKVGFASSVLKSVLLPLEYNNINIKKTSSLCFGNKPIHQHLINYYRRFVSLYKNKRRFGFSWLTQISHEFVNYLELGDEHFYEFFKFLKDDGHLENAFLIFYSDHGSRIDDIRNTFVGRIEERMPMLSIVPPDSFRKKYKELVHTLKENTERLTSNFDLHETLKDILQGNFESTLKFKGEDQSQSERGSSLFTSIPEARSCAEAAIPEHYCACYGSSPISTSDALVIQAGKAAVSSLNNILKQYASICATLTLHKIHEAQLISLGLSSHGEEINRWTIYKFFSNPEAEKHKRFMIMFETEPGNAMFEATVEFSTETGMKVINDISRTNKYGNTSRCVPEKPLRRYCYCKSNDDKLK